MNTKVLGLGRRKLVSAADPLHAGNIHISILDSAGDVLACISVPASHAVVHADNCNDLAQTAMALDIARGLAA